MSGNRNKKRPLLRPQDEGESLAKYLHEGSPIGDLDRSLRQEVGEDTAMDLNGIKITPRDQQVLELLVGGCSNKEIAGQLSISPRTVKQHLRTLFLRAGIKDGRKRVKLAIAVFEKEGANQ